MWSWVLAWIRKHWLWILMGLVLLILGMIAGWRIAAVLGVGTATGGAVSALGESQKRRKAEGKRLEQDRKDLESSAGETDAMIDQYYQRKGGPKR